MDACVQSRVALKEGEVRSFMVQTLAALQHIHGLMCLHRDIKADNILILRERKPPSAPCKPTSLSCESASRHQPPVSQHPYPARAQAAISPL